MNHPIRSPDDVGKIGVVESDVYWPELKTFCNMSCAVSRRVMGLRIVHSVPGELVSRRG